MNKEEIRKTAWESVGDEKLFPNHSDKDIWNNGFDACYNILSTTSQTHKAMSAEEFLINQGYTKIVTYPNKEVVEITFRWETVIRLLNEYTSQPQPLPVGGKSVENCFDEIGNKINTLQDVNLKNRLHAAKDLLKLHLQSSLPVQQPVSDGVELPHTPPYQTVPVYIICPHCNNDMPQAATSPFHYCLYCGGLIT